MRKRPLCLPSSRGQYRSRPPLGHPSPGHLSSPSSPVRRRRGPGACRLPPPPHRPARSRASRLADGAEVGEWEAPAVSGTEGSRLSCDRRGTRSLGCSTSVCHPSRLFLVLTKQAPMGSLGLHVDRVPFGCQGNASLTRPNSDTLLLFLRAEALNDK